MRQLSEEELKLVQKAIALKEITSAEVLMEIYDHYDSQLQEFPEEKFTEQLFELEQKFTYAYCHALQSKFNKSSKAEIGKIQWRVIRQYFCSSRLVFSAGIFAIIFYAASQAKTTHEIGLLFLSPLILLFLVLLAFNWRVHKKISPIKKTFKGMGITIQSSVATPFAQRIYLPVMLAQTVFSVPKIISIEFEFGHFLSGSAGVMTGLLTIYMLSLLEVWKIKSKTALI